MYGMTQEAAHCCRLSRCDALRAIAVRGEAVSLAKREVDSPLGQLSLPCLIFLVELGCQIMTVEKVMKPSVHFLNVHP